MKKDIKKILNTAGIIFIALSLLQIGGILLRIFVIEPQMEKISYNWFDYTCYGLEIFLSLITGITYLVLKNKPREEILKQNKTILAFLILNIFNSFVGWVISFWIEIVFEQERRQESSFVNPFEQLTKSNNRSDENNNDEIVMKDEDYQVLHTETLTTRLEELNRLRSKNLITEEEYAKLRQEAIDKFLN